MFTVTSGPPRRYFEYMFESSLKTDDHSLRLGLVDGEGRKMIVGINKIFKHLMLRVIPELCLALPRGRSAPAI